MLVRFSVAERLPLRLVNNWLTSPAEDEPRIKFLLALFDRVMDRCEATARD